MLNVNLTAKVLGWGELSTEMNILPVLIATGRVHYSPQVGYHNNIYIYIYIYIDIFIYMYIYTPTYKYRNTFTNIYIFFIFADQ